ncbi:MAG: hypothetical protein KDD51_00910, partial [Bdellovibrionales bacterium]|nr:hypothetical protein [Bdellovibrionales bacterium]
MRDLWRRLTVEFHRGWYLFYRELQFRAKLTLFGYGWNIVSQLAAAIPVVFVGKQLNLGGHGAEIPYEIHALTGVVFWGVFWDAVILPMDLAFKSRQVFRRVPIGNMSMIFATVWGLLLNFVVKFLFVAVVMLFFFHIWFKWELILTLLVGLPALIALGLCFGLPFMSFGTVYQDVRYAVGFLGQALMWTAPIFYRVPPKGWLTTFNKL